MTRPARPLVLTQQLHALQQDVSTQVDKLGVWGAVAYHVKRAFSDNVAVLDKRLGSAAWWPSEACRDGAIAELDEVARWCLRTGRARVLSRTCGDGSNGVTALLPLRERGQVTAVLQVALSDPLPPRTLEELAALACFVSTQLSNRAWEQEAALLALLTARLAAASDPRRTAEVALEVLAPAVGASAAALMEVRGRELAPLGATGLADSAALAQRSSRTTTDEYPMRRVINDHEIVWMSEHEVASGPVIAGLPAQGTLAMPLEGRGPVRTVILLTFEPGRAPHESAIPTLLAAADVISAHLSSARRRRGARVRDALLTRERSAQPTDLTAVLMKAAVELVSGADLAFSFHRAEDGAFTPHDDSRSHIGRLSESEALAMYQGSLGEWRSGLPKPFHGVALHEDVLIRDTDPEAAAQGGLDGDRCLCVPLSINGSVTGFLILVSSPPGGAFDEESMSAAWQLSSIASRVLTPPSEPFTRSPSLGPFTGFPSL